MIKQDYTKKYNASTFYLIPYHENKLLTIDDFNQESLKLFSKEAYDDLLKLIEKMNKAELKRRNAIKKENEKRNKIHMSYGLPSLYEAKK